jgi:hypothetical protein
MQVDLSQRYQVVNTETNQAIESHATKNSAEQGARWCNEHEQRHGRPAVYVVRDTYQPKTGERCTCRKGVARDNCPECEGTGWKIDFKAIRERKKQ